MTRRTAPLPTIRAPHDVTRYIPEPVKMMLWGKAAGRCEFAGCNKLLWKSSVTQEHVNIAQKAHIYAFSSDGPRGNKGIPKKKLNDLANLMLVCHECHQKLDKVTDGGRYPVALLQKWKTEHERRIEIVTGIAARKKSHVVLYGANIGDYSSPLNFADTAEALFPKYYPADDKPIELGMVNSSFLDRDPHFWSVEGKNLKTKYDQRVRERLANGEMNHLSIFALAPQPLLILLGSLLTDIPKAEVFQLHREPQRWSWPSQRKAQRFVIHEPTQTKGPPALVLSLSATVISDRIIEVIGQSASIWIITVPKPNNDFTKSRAQLSEFRTAVRSLLDKIKASHGQATPLHIFPAASVSVGLELGRVCMPKADMPWKIYDQVNQRGGFIHALDIPEGV